MFSVSNMADSEENKRVGEYLKPCHSLFSHISQLAITKITRPFSAYMFPLFFFETLELCGVDRVDMCGVGVGDRLPSEVRKLFVCFRAHSLKILKTFRLMLISVNKHGWISYDVIYQLRYILWVVALLGACDIIQDEVKRWPRWPPSYISFKMAESEIFVMLYM